MDDEIEYFFADSPLYTEEAIGVLEEMQDQVDEGLKAGDGTQVPVYATLQGEKESLEDYLEELRPYNEFLREAHQSFEVPGSHILERVEQDMDLMARERHSKLGSTAFNGDSRREVLSQVMPDDAPTPVLADAWAIMTEAEGLREYLDRRIE
jgi:hypothetical protein